MDGRYSTKVGALQKGGPKGPPFFFDHPSMATKLDSKLAGVRGLHASKIWYTVFYKVYYISKNREPCWRIEHNSRFSFADSRRSLLTPLGSYLNSLQRVAEGRNHEFSIPTLPSLTYAGLGESVGPFNVLPRTVFKPPYRVEALT